VPVAAGVLRDAQVRAGLAAFDMTAQRRRSAALDRGLNLELAEAHMAGIRRTPSRPAVAEEFATSTAGRDNGCASAGHL
jgi:hypothetical protein